MKSCELCMLAATTYCEPDKASLCWDCDAKVHGANFLVARHVRCLLCHACQSPTPWTASGFKLGYNVSVCDMCVNGGDRAQNDNHKDEEDADSNDDDADNQVVPWCTISNTLSPASTSSGGEREVSKSKTLFPLKGLRATVSDFRFKVGFSSDSLST